MVATIVEPALPIASTEGNDATAVSAKAAVVVVVAATAAAEAVAGVVAEMVDVVVGTVRGMRRVWRGRMVRRGRLLQHEGRGGCGRRIGIAVAKLVRGRGRRRHGGEGATETSGAALEVGEAAGGTGPVAGTGPVLAGGEGREDVSGGSAVEHAAGRRADLDGLFIEGAAIHAETLGGFLVRGKDGKALTGGLVLVGGLQSKEGYGAATVLGVPALELGLGSVVGQAGHVKHLRALGEEGAHVGAGVHWLA